MKKLLIALAVLFGTIVFLSVAIMSFVLGSSSQEIEVTQHFFETLSSDSEAAYEQTAGIFKEFSSLEDFQSLLLDVPEIQSVKDSRFPTRSTTTTDGLRVTALLGTLTLDDGEKMLIEVLLVDEEENGVQVPHVAGFDIDQDYVQSRINELNVGPDSDDYFESSITGMDPI